VRWRWLEGGAKQAGKGLSRWTWIGIALTLGYPAAKLYEWEVCDKPLYQSLEFCPAHAYGDMSEGKCIHLPSCEEYERSPEDDVEEDLRGWSDDGSEEELRDSIDAQMEKQAGKANSDHPWSRFRNQNDQASNDTPEMVDYADLTPEEIEELHRWMKKMGIVFSSFAETHRGQLSTYRFSMERKLEGTKSPYEALENGGKAISAMADAIHLVDGCFLVARTDTSPEELFVRWQRIHPRVKSDLELSEFYKLEWFLDEYSRAVYLVLQSLLRMLTEVAVTGEFSQEHKAGLDGIALGKYIGPHERIEYQLL